LYKTDRKLKNSEKNPPPSFPFFQNRDKLLMYQRHQQEKWRWRAVQDWGLPENKAVEARLREAADRGALSHALLFTGSGDRMTAALLAAAAFQCAAGSGKPCGVCAPCRKVRQGIHPDVTVVRDEAHKSIAIDVVRQVRADAYIRPNEGARKVYIFPDCQLLTEADQNVLLKIVEEGPPYAAFCFCAENPAAVLPTLRSRCVELKLRPAAEDPDAPLNENAVALCRAMALKKAVDVTELLVRLGRAKFAREDLSALLDDCRDLFAAALLAASGGHTGGQRGKIADVLSKRLTNPQIMGTIEILQKYRQQCQYNINAAQAMGALAVELEEVL